jgi:lipoprotein-anchoring transpeptidase ErfK/SrfK
MLRGAIAGVAFAVASVSMSSAAFAQWGWGRYDDDRAFRDYPYPFQYQGPSYRRPPGGDFFWGDERPRRPASPSPRSGGARPQIEPVAPGRISFPNSYPVGSVVIDHKGRQLFFVESAIVALRYPISVGREGFSWTGSERISKTVNWPDWHPPADMRARDPSLPEHMSGGLRNPLGAKALYLGSTLYRIHGTNDPRSIGRAASSGCFRMLNGHVVDLASRVQIGTLVTVVSRLPPELDRAVAQQVREFGALAPAEPAVREPAAITAPPPPPARHAAPADEEGPAGEGAGGREPS